MKKNSVILWLITILLLSSFIAITGCKGTSEETEPQNEAVQTDVTYTQPAEFDTTADKIPFVEIAMFVILFLLIIILFLLLRNVINDVEKIKRTGTNIKGKSSDGEKIKELEKKVNELSGKVWDLEDRARNFESKKNEHNERRDSYKIYSAGLYNTNDKSIYGKMPEVYNQAAPSTIPTTSNLASNDVIENFNHYKSLNDKKAFYDLFKGKMAGIENYNDCTNYNTLNEIILSDKSSDNKLIILEEGGAGLYYKVVPELDALVKSRMIDYYRIIFDIDTTIDDMKEPDAFILKRAAEVELLTDGRYKIVKKGMITTR